MYSFAFVKFTHENVVEMAVSKTNNMVMGDHKLTVSRYAHVSRVTHERSHLAHSARTHAAKVRAEQETAKAEVNGVAVVAAKKSVPSKHQWVDLDVSHLHDNVYGDVAPTALMPSEPPRNAVIDYGCEIRQLHVRNHFAHLDSIERRLKVRVCFTQSTRWCYRLLLTFSDLASSSSSDGGACECFAFWPDFFAPPASSGN
jgi:hypothetical protein